MGRRAKPIALLEEEGTYRKDRHGDRGASIKKIDYVLQCPASLKEKRAIAAWNRIVPELCRLEMVSIASWELLESAFQNLAIANEMLDEVKKQGGVIKYLDSLTGKSEKDLLFEWQRYMTNYERIMGKFGATPTDESKMRGFRRDDPPDKKQAALEAILNNG